MKLAPVAQNLLEWLALKGGFVPTPLAHAHFGFMMSKFLLEAVDKGVFEAIKHHSVSLKQIAATCNLNESALYSLLGVLASLGLIKEKHNQFELTKPAKKWLLKDSPNSIYWLLIFDNRVCLQWMDHVGNFLETGKGIDYHNTLNEEEWYYYQKAMEAAATATSKEAIRVIPVPKHATQMLDIGGAHGLYSIKLCSKYPGLQSTILDLPEAVTHAAAILQQHAHQNKIKHLAGNIVTDDIGENVYDLVLMASVSHHLTERENAIVAEKVYKALKPGGFFTIIEVLRNDTIKLNGDMLSGLGNFFFALSSTSGTWSMDEITGWQKRAGFRTFKKTHFLSIPGYVAITAKK